MEMNKEESLNIVNQLQQAHRISVAFYQRILPTFDLIANQFGCNFYYWEPLVTSLPGRRTSQPSRSWAWDYVPLYASRHVYRSVKNEKSSVPDDIGIIFDLYIDDNFSEEKCTKGMPDPVKHPVGIAILEVELYRPRAKIKKSFDDLWEEETSNPKVGKWGSVSDSWDGIAFKWPLAEVISNKQLVIQELQKYIELVE